ncbi:hypothetical protein AQUCO_02600041v1 [Aquilegia coerulea]|uniref:non-specific serine/threonine protein kinase n=1 Tax=Aquilegia coerulea TaxID=218851 RepID=A0A2G5D7Y6_AQUCA|nr:hypothetical protein AQUCO_02600041v1 [Aquilegia coerulea]
MVTGRVVGYGTMGPISAAFGDNGFFCAIDASGKQEIFCWEKDNSSSSASAYFSSLPSMAALSGGEGFMCGIVANTSLPYCWNSSVNSAGTVDLVPSIFRNTAYSHIAAGKNHVCAIRGSYFSSNIDSGGSVDCWEIDKKLDNDAWESEFFSPIVSNLVSGEDFSCGTGGDNDDSIVCWGPKSESLGIPAGNSVKFLALASNRDSICGISRDTGEVNCWGDANSFGNPPLGTQFVALTAGLRHFCGIREDDHGIECWGGNDHDTSSLIPPKNSGFLGVGSSDFTTCGVREDDLILDCWGMQKKPSLPPDYSPPLQLCSPGLCSSGSCGEGMFTFNASILGVPDLTSLCVREDLRICSPCGLNCSAGFFTSSICSGNADRVCTACSLCQNSSCWDICKITKLPETQGGQQHQIKKLAIIVGSSVSGFMLVVIASCLLTRTTDKREEQGKNKCSFCIRKPQVEVDIITEQLQLPLSRAASIGTAQVFRLSELKDATNGFKEFNELGRGSYGFVYKAVLSDGQQVAVKRANAATIIHTNSRDFEAELEILCNMRHGNIVNLLGYCAEMGERLLVYEFMPHGTLHDHLHGGLSSLNWNLRLKISMQAAKGLEYLHKGMVPPIVHCDVKSSNILLDSDWGGRIADFGPMSTGHKDQNKDLESDVYSFGIVLLEILSGRKAYDSDYTPPGIVEWAVPLIKQGKAAAIIDRNVVLPRNVEPLLKFAEIAELAVKEEASRRPKMSDVAMWLEQIVKCGLIL